MSTKETIIKTEVGHNLVVSQASSCGVLTNRVALWNEDDIWQSYHMTPNEAIKLAYALVDAAGEALASERG